MAAPRSRVQDTPGQFGWLNMSRQTRRQRAVQYARQKNRVALTHLCQAYLSTLDLKPGTELNHLTRLKVLLFEAQDSGVRLHPPRGGDAQRILTNICHQGQISLSTLRLHASSLRLLYDALHWAGLSAYDPFEGQNVKQLCLRLMTEDQQIRQLRGKPREHIHQRTK